MKHTRLFAKLIAVFAVLTVVFASAFTLFACNRNKNKVTINDIFKSQSSEKEFSDYKEEFTLPVGWKIYTSSVSSSSQSSSLNSDVGYIKSLDAFVVSKDGNLSIVKCGDSRVYYTGLMEGMVFPDWMGISALRIKGNLIVCKFKNNDVGAFDINGNTVISRVKLGSKSVSDSISNVNIDNIIRILDDGLIAVHYNYDRLGGRSGYTTIYRPSYDGDIDSRGKLVCRIENNDNALGYVNGFDKKYVSVVGNKVGGDRVYLIPESSSDPQNVTSTTNGTLVNDGHENYEKELTYVGKGKFFMYEAWTVGEKDEYDYTDGSKYWMVQQHIYTPDNDRLEEYKANDDKIFVKMTNNYYGAAKSGIETSSYLNDGFIYVSYGLFIEGEKKVGFYDQYILDDDLNVVMSLTGNFGITIKDQKKDSVGVYDLVMTKVDGYFYVPLQPSEINIFDGNGKLVGHNDRTTVIQQELSNNMLIAGIVDPDDDDEALYGAFNIKGEEVIEFKYKSLAAFRGAYTIGERYDEDTKKTVRVLIGVDGVEITRMSDGSTPLGDMSSASAYKIGCYVFKETRDGTDYFGIKNFNPNVGANVVMPAFITGKSSLLYASNSSPSDVFMFEEVTNGNNVSYTVYRLI